MGTTARTASRSKALCVRRTARGEEARSKVGAKAASPLHSRPMARRSTPGQSSLNLGLPGLRQQRFESHVEYDRERKKAPQPEGLVFQRPTPPPRPPSNSETPWWDRVRQIAESGPQRAPEPVSFAQTWRGLLSEAGWFEELPPAHRALLEACVRSLDVRPGVVESGIGKTGERPHRVQLRLPAFTQADWARVLRRVVDDGRAESMLRDLDAGRVPIALIEGCDACELVLAPRKLSLVLAACSCGGAAAMCDHVKATHLALIRHLGKEPLSLIVFRGGAVDELRTLLARLQEEAARTRVDANPLAPLDPFAAPVPLSWNDELASLPESVWRTLPVIEGWRARESFDAMCRRLLAPAREACGAKKS